MDLTDIQNEIVRAPLGAMLVTAGAGSGKTRVLTHRLAYVIQKLQIPDKNIAALTFTNKAGNEMRERVEKLLGGAFGTFIGTFHSFCVRLLRRNIKELNAATGASWTNDFSIYADDDTKKVIKQLVAAKSLPDDEKDEFVKKVKFHLGEYKNSGLNLNRYIDENKFAGDIELVRDVIAGYGEILKKK